MTRRFDDTMSDLPPDYGFRGLHDAMDVLVSTLGPATVGAPLHEARYVGAMLAYQFTEQGKLEAVQLDDETWLAFFTPFAGAPVVDLQAELEAIWAEATYIQQHPYTKQRKERLARAKAQITAMRAKLGYQSLP